MLYLSTVESTTLELLKRLQQLPVLSNTRLVGGTALALQLGHRKSIDLDFFGQINVNSQELREALQTLGMLTVLSDSKNIHIYVLNGVKIDIVNYTYPWIDDVVCKDGIRLASPKDIAAMKITAIEGRGTKKDFVDIYFLLKTYSLNNISERLLTIPECAFWFMAMKSLAYFEDAEEDPMPYMFVDVSWDEIKRSILSHL